MTRESKPTLTPRTELTKRESEMFSRFVFVADKDPIFALSCVKSYVTNSEIVQEARQLSTEGPLTPEGQVLSAVADLVDSEIIFVLEADEQTKAAEAQHTVGREVASMAKIKGFLGELAAHQVYTEGQLLQDLSRRTIERDYANYSTDSDLYVAVVDSRPNLDAA